MAAVDADSDAEPEEKDPEEEEEGAAWRMSCRSRVQPRMPCRGNDGRGRIKRAAAAATAPATLVVDDDDDHAAEREASKSFPRSHGVESPLQSTTWSHSSTAWPLFDD